ncbi:TLC domain-containing protein [Hyaloraphidium curvatum]|nr:TLC domain-containing protein [Hyaloraphidium curvatum]
MAAPLRLGRLPDHVWTIVATAASCQALMALAHPLSKRIAGRYYTALSKARQIDWRSRVVSFVFATGILAGSVALMASGDYDGLRADKIFGYTAGGGRLAAFASGYFIWDTILCLRYANLFGAPFLIHGIGCLIVMLFGLQPFLMYYGPRVLVFEASTPFLNINYWLDKFGLTGSKAQLVNGVLLLSAFFSTRIVWGWYLTHDFFSASLRGPAPPRLLTPFPPSAAPSAELWRRRAQLSGALPAIFMAANLVLNSLNLYWFVLMVRSVAKRFDGPKEGGKPGKGKEKAGEGEKESADLAKAN